MKGKVPGRGCYQPAETLDYFVGNVFETGCFAGNSQSSSTDHNTTDITVSLSHLDVSRAVPRWNSAREFARNIRRTGGPISRQNSGNEILKNLHNMRRVPVLCLDFLFLPFFSAYVMFRTFADTAICR